MSAYGVISAPLTRPKAPLQARTYPLKANPGNTVLVLHVTRETAPTELVGLLHEEFEQELESGKTYPQEGPMDRAIFEAYFFAADVFVGMIASDESAASLEGADVDKVREGRSWDESVVGYVPFMVPPVCVGYKLRLIHARVSRSYYVSNQATFVAFIHYAELK